MRQFLFYAALACSSVLVHYRLGRHQDTLTPADILHVAKWNWIPQPFSIMNLAFVKLSISFLLLLILGPHTKWSKLFLHVNMVLFKITMIVASILTFVQCDPPRALWEPVPGATCWDPAIQAGYATFGGDYSAFLDFALALLPLTILRGLSTSWKKKIISTVCIARCRYTVSRVARLLGSKNQSMSLQPTISMRSTKRIERKN